MMPSFVHRNILVDRHSAPIAPDWILSGAPIAKMAELFRSRDGKVETVTWDCSPGEFNWFYELDETAYIIDGVAILDEGLPTERYMRAGDVVYFPAGSRTRWRVESHLHKVAFVRSTRPNAVTWMVNLLRKVKHWRPGNRKSRQGLTA